MNTDTFATQIAGAPYKVVSEATGEILIAFHDLDYALAYADAVWAMAATPHHCRVVEVRDRGGSRRPVQLAG